MTVLFFTISIVAGFTLLALSLASLWRPRIRFWPPPGIDTWQYRVFWWLFRIFFVGVLLVCILDFGAIGSQHVVQFVVGIPLAILGFSLAFYVTFLLGWRDAHGEAKGLVGVVVDHFICHDGDFGMAGGDKEGAKHDTNTAFLHIGKGSGDLAPFIVNNFRGADVGG